MDGIKNDHYFGLLRLYRLSGVPSFFSFGAVLAASLLALYRISGEPLAFTGAADLTLALAGTSCACGPTFFGVVCARPAMLKRSRINAARIVFFMFSFFSVTGDCLLAVIKVKGRVSDAKSVSPDGQRKSTEKKIDTWEDYCQAYLQLFGKRHWKRRELNSGKVVQQPLTFWTT